MTFRRFFFCVFIAIAACVFTSATSAQAQGNFIRGDVNCDSLVNGSDTTKLIFHIFMGSPVNCLDAADVDDDGQVSLADLTTLAGHLHGIGPAPPPPYPNCGQDLTPDVLDCQSSCCTPQWTCPIVRTGDCNGDDVITSADLIGMVNFVFKGGAPPLPCVATADVNCNGSVTSADIVYLVGFVFKSSTAPCDVCTLMPETWTCP